MPRSSARLIGKRVDYDKVENRYKGMKFTRKVTKPKHRHLANGNHGAPGRSKSAPTLTFWPVTCQHLTVTYIEDIAADDRWADPDTDQILLPFRKGSKHKQSASQLHGMVVTAQWRSDGRLGYSISDQVRYLT